MIKAFKTVVVVAVVGTLLLFPGEGAFLSARPAAAASGATFAFPPDNNFEAGPELVGSGPANYDFNDGGAGWTKIGTVTYSGGVATLSGGAQITSSTYTLSSTIQAVKVRYRYPAGANATVSVLVGLVTYGTDNLTCPIGCTAGAWIDKYIAVYTSAPGQSVTLKVNQTSGTTEIDHVGTQWISFHEWLGSSAGIKSQPKLDGSQIAEVRSTLFTKNFVLTQNRVKFQYAFPLPSGNSLTAYLHRASDGLQLSALAITGNGVGWTWVSWTWGADYTGQTVYLRFYSTETAPSWVDNVAVNLGEGVFVGNHPSADAGDPFDTSTAQSLHSHTDVAVPGRGVPLEFSRYYNSMAATPGDLGYSWRHSYAWSLGIDADQSVDVRYPSGGAAYFKYNAGSFTPPAGVYDTLVRTGSPGSYIYTLTTKSQIRYEFAGSTPVLTSIKDRNNNTTTLSYTGGRLSLVTDASGTRSLTFNYDGSNRITRVNDPLSRTVEFTYDTNGDLWKVKDVKGDPTNGPFTVYTYSNHRMTSLTDSNGHLQNTTIYDGANRVVEQTDATGGKTCVYYGTPPAYTSAACTGVTPAPAAGQTVVVDPRQHKTTYDFDTKFRTTGVTDHDGGVTSFAYDSNNNQTSATDPRSKVSSYTYDSKGNVLTEMNPLRQPVGPAESGGQCNLPGQTNDTGNGVDDDGDTRVDDGCPSSKYVFTSINDPDLETDALGRLTDYVYDSAGNLTRIVRKDSGGAVKALTCFERDISGQPNGWGQVIASVPSTNLVVPPGPTDACTGNKTLFGYDTYGNQDCVVNARFSQGQPNCAAAPIKSSYTFDLGGRMETQTGELRQPNGAGETGAQCNLPGQSNGTGNGVDDDGDTKIDDGCPSARYTYDPQNNVLTVADGLGNVTTSAYDPKGNLTSVKDANRKTAGATPESGAGQCGVEGTGDGENDDPGDDSVTDDGCLSVVYRYDNGDRLEKVIQAAVSTTSIPTTTYSYDANGDRTAVTSPKTTLRPVGSNGPESPAQCGSTGLGNGVNEDAAADDTVADDGCPSVLYAYDALDRLQSVTDQLNRVTLYQYDLASNLTQRTDARGLITKYIPDDLNRLDLVEHRLADNSLVDTIDYVYNIVGSRTQMVDPTGTTNYAYDALNRLTCAGPNTISGSCPSGNVGYTYDDVPGGVAAEYPGQRTKITYPDGRYVDYTHLADGRMSTVKDWLNRQTTYTYGDSGRLDRADYPNGLWTLYGYDSADRLTSVVNRDSAAIRSSFTYTLDAIGNRTQDVDNVGTTTYQYDALYRLAQESNWDPAIVNYTYDANGNRSTKGSTSYTYDGTDQMVMAGGVSYGYDANGNQMSRGSDTFTYDHENRLTQSVIGGATSSSTYNGDGLRMSHTVSGQTTSYTWDVAAGLPVVLKDNTYTYVYGLDLISATDAGGNQNYYMYNGLGSVTNIVDYSGAEKAVYFYDAFGIPRFTNEVVANTWRYTGEQRDGDSGFYYLRARYYDPYLGRFVSQDPAGAGHPYAYVENNPTNLLDPSGLCTICIPNPFDQCFVRWFGDTCANGGVDDAGQLASNLTKDIAAIATYAALHPDSSLRGGIFNEFGALIIAAGSNCDDRREKEGGIVIYENCGGLASWFLNSVNKRGFTFGSFVFAKTELSPELQSHELCHIPQWEFYAGEFLLQYLVTPGMFEEEADLCARQ